jgi:FixJ family two-component response regulator
MARKLNTTEAPIVFIVDDDVSVRRSTGRFVRSLGMRAETFASAQHLLPSKRKTGALRSGSVASLRKPVGKDALLRVIHMALKTVK